MDDGDRALLLSLKLLAFAKAMHRRCGQRSAASCGDVDVMQVRLNSSVCFLLRARPVSFGYLCLHCSAAAAVSTLLVTDLRVQAIATESTLPHLLVDFQAYWNWLDESENLTSWRSF